MSPTFELRPAVLREYRKLDPRMQRAFDPPFLLRTVLAPHVVWRRVGDHSILDRP